MRGLCVEFSLGEGEAEALEGEGERGGRRGMGNRAFVFCPC